jgi:prophage regulatory protein
MNMNVNTIPETGFLRLNQVLSVIPVSKSTWWEGCKKGRYPKSIKHGGATFWRAEDIRQLIKEISEG